MFHIIGKLKSLRHLPMSDAAADVSMGCSISPDLIGLFCSAAPDGLIIWDDRTGQATITERALRVPFDHTQPTWTNVRRTAPVPPWSETVRELTRELRAQILFNAKLTARVNGDTTWPFTS